MPSRKSLNPVRLRGLVVVCISALVAWVATSRAARAQTVWSGYTYNFTKSAFADPTLPENQDAIAPTVVLTRAQTLGMYNVVFESEYDQLEHDSPFGTEWATDINNPGATIAATNWAALTFGTWRSAYHDSEADPPIELRYTIVDRNAVVRLIGAEESDDIYIDLRFTSWGGGFGGHGGAFSYVRAEPPEIETTGDYNGNGTVDAADYTVWRNTFGDSVANVGDGADGDQSGEIDEGDYDFWKANFGAIVPGTGSGAGLAVPEPSTLVSVLGTLLALGTYRKLLRRGPRRQGR
jgi:hypothetical protein